MKVTITENEELDIEIESGGGLFKVTPFRNAYGKIDLNIERY